MKRILIGFALAAIVAGCNNKAEEKAEAQAVRDSIILAQEKARLDSFERADAAEKAAVAAVAKERERVRSTSTSSSGSSNRAAYISDNGSVYYSARSKKTGLEFSR
jgi:hypothetical protein